jgi:hypothetical protein
MRPVESGSRFRRERQGRRVGKPIRKGRKPCNRSSVQQEPVCKKPASLLPLPLTTREKAPDKIGITPVDSRCNPTLKRHPALKQGDGNSCAVRAAFSCPLGNRRGHQPGGHRYHQITSCQKRGCCRERFWLHVLLDVWGVHTPMSKLIVIHDVTHIEVEFRKPTLYCSSQISQ